MTRVGIIARADQGGLAQMACEFAKGYEPDAAILVDLGGGGRGDADHDRIVPHVRQHWVSNGAYTGDAYRFPIECDPFFDAVDVVYAQETVYDRRSYTITDAHGLGLVLHAMPELLSRDALRKASTLWLPTEWRWEEVTDVRRHYGLPDPILMPVPIDVDDWKYRQRTSALTFCIIGAGAFYDRNGLDAVYQALPFVQTPIRLYVRGGPRPGMLCWTDGRASVEWLEPCDDYHDVIPDDVDVLLMPRRYGGLSMPVREAAARGIPTLMTDLDPQRSWDAAITAIPTTGSEDVRMLGGPIPVHTMHYRDISDAIERLATEPERVTADRSARARAWAESLDWSLWRGRYSEEFAAAADRGHAAWKART